MAETLVEKGEETNLRVCKVDWKLEIKTTQYGRITHVQGRCMGESHVCRGGSWEDHVCAGEVHGKIMHVQGRCRGGSHVCRGGAWEDHVCVGEVHGRIMYV